MDVLLTLQLDPQVFPSMKHEQPSTLLTFDVLPIVASSSKQFGVKLLFARCLQFHLACKVVPQKTDLQLSHPEQVWVPASASRAFWWHSVTDQLLQAALPRLMPFLPAIASMREQVAVRFQDAGKEARTSWPEA